MLSEKIWILDKKVTKIRVSEIRVSEIRVSEIRVSEIRVNKIRVTEIRVSEIRISSNHSELHGAIFFFFIYVHLSKSQSFVFLLWRKWKFLNLFSHQNTGAGKQWHVSGRKIFPIAIAFFWSHSVSESQVISWLGTNWTCRLIFWQILTSKTFGLTVLFPVDLARSRVADGRLAYEFHQTKDRVDSFSLDLWENETTLSSSAHINFALSYGTLSPLFSLCITFSSAALGWSTKPDERPICKSIWNFVGWSVLTSPCWRTFLGGSYQDEHCQFSAVL